MKLTSQLTCYDGRVYELPPLLEGLFSYGEGLPCDSFWLKCPWSGGSIEGLDAAVRLVATEGGTVRFTGVVDEVRCTVEDKGRFLEVSGRGMAALLLDNEALAEDYLTATLDDIVQRHVAPYGIAVAPCALPAVQNFSVPSGSSQWQVVYDFACYHGGVIPRFDEKGCLVLAQRTDGTVLALDETVPVLAMEYCGKRYGVPSQVLVRDKPSKTVETVENKRFIAEGGRCGRVITMPGCSNYRAMRYSGEFQLKQGAASRRRLKVTLPGAFFAKVGDKLQVSRKDWGIGGLWRVGAVETGVRADGWYSNVTLWKEET